MAGREDECRRQTQTVANLTDREGGGTLAGSSRMHPSLGMHTVASQMLG